MHANDCHAISFLQQTDRDGFRCDPNTRPNVGDFDTSRLVISITGWWFGTMEFYDFPIILGMSSS